MYVRLMASAASLALLFQAPPAFAAWETITSPRPDDSNCRAPHDTNGFALLRASENRPLRIAAGTKKEIEIYGHGIDTSTSTRITGVSGASSSGLTGVGGGFNAARGCGNIGSTKVTITTPLVSSENGGVLEVGSERIPITVVPRRVSDVTWDNSSGGGGSVRQSNGQVPVNCQNNTSTCVQAPSSSSSGTTADTATLVRCIDNAGGRGEFSGDTLTVTLPDQRTTLGNCWTRHFLVDLDLAASNVDLSGGGALPTITADANGPTPEPTFAEQDNARGQFGRVRLPATFVSTLAGDYSWNINFAPASGTQRLVLRVKSVVPYGVASIAAPVVLPNVGRLNSNIAPTARLNQPAQAGQAFGWRLEQEGANPAPATCFTATNGTVNPAAGAPTVAIPLTVREDAACYNRQFSLHVAPETRLGDDVIYGRSQVFTLLPLNRVIQPPNQVPALPAGVVPRI